MTVTVPVLHAADVVVVGGSLVGVEAALTQAALGKRVVVVEPSTFLGHEITHTLRYWIEADAVRGRQRTPGVLGALADAAIGDADQRAIWPDRLKTGLEDRLLDAGVELLYGLRGVHAYEHGIVVAGKSGRGAIAAPELLCSPEQLASFGAASGGRRNWVCIELTGLHRPLPERLVVADDRHQHLMRTHPGSQGREHALVEVMLVEDPHRGALTSAARVRRRAVRLFSDIRRQYSEAADSWLAAVSPRPYRGWTSGSADWARSALPDPAPALDLLGASPAPESGWRGLLAAASGTEPVAVATLTETTEVRRVTWSEPSPTGPRIVVPGPPRTTSVQADVVVVGGGSSGASAAAAAAADGAVTVLVDAGAGLGGTGTYGGVDSYWFGRRSGAASRTRAAVKRAHSDLGIAAGSGRGWNIEVKADALTGLVVDAGASILSESTVFGAVVTESRVRGVVVSTPDGVVVVDAALVIDATGDADVAVAAGAAVRHGADRTHSSMWFSLAQFVEPGRTKNNFGGVVDVGDPRDVTRAVLAARRRGGLLHDHGAYLAPRESRNIVGDVTMTLTDQLRRRRVPDVINVHFSNHDIKGVSESIWTLMGLIPPNLEIEIPYRALLPAGIDGMLVVGKALSVTHDGLAAVRMQSDLENLGAVAGTLAAHMLETETTPRTLDVAAAQQLLLSRGMLEPDRLREPAPAVRRSLEDLIEEVVTRVPLHTYALGRMRDVHLGGIAFVELVHHADPATNDRVAERMSDIGNDAEASMVLARVLVCRGDHRGGAALMAHLQRALSGPRLPERRSDIRHAQLPPDQAAMPDEAYLLYTLALARHRDAPSIWQLVAEKIDASDEAMRSMTVGTFAYVHAVAYGAERLGAPAALGPLDALRSHRTLRNQHSTTGRDPDVFAERRAMLEMALAAATARCGDIDGARTLGAYLRDARGPFRRRARSELAAILGWSADAGCSELSHWLAQTAALQPQPLPRTADLWAPDGLDVRAVAQWNDPVPRE